MTNRSDSKSSIASRVKENPNRSNPQKLINHNNHNTNVLSDAFFFSSNLSAVEMNPEKDLENTLISNLKSQYEDRLRSLYNKIKDISLKFEEDEILKTLKKDSITKEFSQDRLREIVNEQMMHENEGIISKYLQENAELNSIINSKNGIIDDYKNKYSMIKHEQESKIKQYESLCCELEKKNQEIEEENKKLNKEIKSLKKHFQNETNRISEDLSSKLNKKSLEAQKYKNEKYNTIETLQMSDEKLKEVIKENEELRLEMDRLQKVISVLEIDLSNNNEILNEKQSKIEFFQKEVTNHQACQLDLNLKLKKVADENKSLTKQFENTQRELKNLYEKYNSISEDQKQIENEKLRRIEENFNENLAIYQNKINSLKENVINLEEELKSEKSNSLNIKISYSKLITTMQEDMKLIKNEWEKKCLNQENEYEIKFNDQEDRHYKEIEFIKAQHHDELGLKIKEIQKLKVDSDSLKNFEQEYIKISQFDQEVNVKVNEIKKKLISDNEAIEKKLENEFKVKFEKIVEEKKFEFEFLTENLRKNLSQAETQLTELKNANYEFEKNAQIERGRNEKLNEKCSTLETKLNSINSEMEISNKKIDSLNSEIKQNILIIDDLKKVILELSENLNKSEALIQDLEKERKFLVCEIKSKENSFLQEINKFQKDFSEYKDSTCSKIEEDELKIKELLFDLQETKLKLKEKENDFISLERDFKDTHSQLEESLGKISLFQKKIKDLETLENNQQLKINSLIQKNQKEKLDNKNNLILFQKLVSHKLQLMKSEMNQMKASVGKDINNIKKESVTMIEAFSSKLILHNHSLENKKEEVMILSKISSEKELLKQNEEKEKALKQEISLISSKYEKHLLEQFKINEKQEKEIKKLVEVNHNEVLMNRELSFKIKEMEQEYTKVKNSIESIQKEKENLREKLDKQKKELKATQKESKIIEINKNQEDSQKKEINEKLIFKLKSVLRLVNSNKKKYQNEIFKLKTELEKISLIVEGDKKKMMKERNELIKEIEEKEKVIELYQINNNSCIENQLMIEDYDKKIKDFQTKNSELEEKYKLVKSKLKKYKEIKSPDDLSKTLIKSLKSQIQCKNEEIEAYKEYEKTVLLKDKKIFELQNIISKSNLPLRNQSKGKNTCETKK